METSASFEARSAPSSYPTKGDLPPSVRRNRGGKHAPLAFMVT
jgi:hypothetical protein